MKMNSRSCWLCGHTWGRHFVINRPLVWGDRPYRRLAFVYPGLDGCACKGKDWPMACHCMSYLMGDDEQ